MGKWLLHRNVEKKKTGIEREKTIKREEADGKSGSIRSFPSGPLRLSNSPCELLCIFLVYPSG